MNDLNVCWWGNNGNWGDQLNKVLCSKISGKNINRINLTTTNNIFRYYCVGSILQTPCSPNFEVWGSGFSSKERSKLKFKPNKIHAVRGPLTRELLLLQDIDCPEIYGDPALLYPFFYKPNVTKKYKYGIIPHYVDADNIWVNKYKHNKNVKIINILNHNTDKFVDDINECEILLSSSLHGIIAGDAYGIPSYWIELSDKVLGNGFKFRDYFSSVNRPLYDPIKPKLNDYIKDFSHNFYEYKINIDLEKLYNSCPFKNKKLKDLT